MASIIPGYEYDIFISYRQKDNKYDGWVTSFVEDIQKELDATFKEDISIYFDENPHHGLHDTHDVDESLKEKIKCLVLIPILSQTYCDPRSFAWQHEFLAFRDFAANDRYGLKLKVSGGNVISRILPVCIHDLDKEDKDLFEKESGSYLRSVDFIYSSPGVNRPLRNFEDNASDNLNKTYYRDQVNKVAQSIKEIILAIKSYDTEIPEEVTASPAVEKPSRRSRIKQRTSQNKSLISVAFVALLIIAIIYTGFIFIYDNDAVAKEDKSIAVLPFIDLSQNSENEYFSDGITEDIITQISKISDLKVISRSSVMRYKNSGKDIVEIGEELGVGTILEGTVRLSENRARITANLSDASNRQQVWAETYDREIEDLFNLQADVAKDIVIALKANFSGSSQDRDEMPTKSIEAYSLFLKSKYNYAKGEKEGFRMAIEQAKEAIEIDPEFANAYALLANAYSVTAYYRYHDILPADEAREKAMKAARKSIELNPYLPEGHDALGYGYRTHRWDWENAEKEVKKAISLNPNFSSSHRRYSLLLAAMGRFEEAIKEATLSLELDPLGAFYNSDLARIYHYAGKSKDAMNLALKAFEMEPGYRPAMGVLACALEYSGKKDSSVVWASKSATRSATDYEGVPGYFKTEPKPYKEYWKEVLERSLEDAKEEQIPNMVMAVLYMRNDNHEGAIKSLQKAYELREGSVVYINVEPLFKPLHSDPRFQEIIRGMGLKPSGE